MKRAIVFVLLIFLLSEMVFALAFCGKKGSQDMGKNTTNNSGTINRGTQENLVSPKGFNREDYPGWPEVFNNDVAFTFRQTIDMTIEEFTGYVEREAPSASDITILFPTEAIRNNKSEYYTVYRLEDGKLAYVRFVYRPETGVGWYFGEVIGYPSKAANKKLNFVLEKDLPQNILK